MLTWFEPMRKYDTTQTEASIDSYDIRKKISRRKTISTYPNFNIRIDQHSKAIYYSLACLSDCLNGIGSSLEEINFRIQELVFLRR